MKIPLDITILKSKYLIENMPRYKFDYAASDQSHKMLSMYTNCNDLKVLIKGDRNNYHYNIMDLVILSYTLYKLKLSATLCNCINIWISKFDIYIRRFTVELSPNVNSSNEIYIFYRTKFYHYPYQRYCLSNA